MFRVLHVMPAADIGGISAVILNYYRFIDREIIQFDVALTSDREGLDAQHFKNLGAKFFHIPPKSQNYAEYKSLLTRILTQGKYDCIHVHENMTSYVALRIAKRAGIKHRIAHSHTSAPYRSIKEEVKRISGCFLNAHYATCLIGCGKLAGERVFGKWNMQQKKALILPNAIDSNRYAFNALIRERMRKNLGLENKHVIGMVGRLAPEKNQQYALHIMQELHDVMPDAVMLLVGNGEDEEMIQNTIARQNMGDYVIMLGKRDDVADLYQAFDVLIMPSLHEGFPVAAVEAVSSGLPVLLSDTITKELHFGPVKYLKLGDDKAWIDAMLQTVDIETRMQWINFVKARGLDIRSAAKILEAIYLNESVLKQ